VVRAEVAPSTCFARQRPQLRRAAMVQPGSRVGPADRRGV